MKAHRQSLRGFDLLKEPWITGVSIGGDATEYGIASLFEQSHELTEIVDPSPLVVVGVLRLLEAALLWSLEIDDEDHWIDLWAVGRFESHVLERIGERCSGRMDLFDDRRPFYQSSDVCGTGDSERVKSVGYLFPEAATGTGVVHYSHAPKKRMPSALLAVRKGWRCFPPSQHRAARASGRPSTGFRRSMCWRLAITSSKPSC